jgi:glutamate--cysteine ligase catalytic subunit
VPPIVCPGFLEAGEPYTWDESREDGIMEWVRTHGIDQFLAMWEKVKAIRCDDLRWGDELEYSILSANGDDGTVRCKLRGAEILAKLREQELALQAEDEAEGEAGMKGGTKSEGCSWVPEYGAWMVEGTPAHPYTGTASALLSVERNMRTRRARLLAVLEPDEICPTIPCFPLIGVGEFTEPALPAGGPVTKSLFVPDDCINPHPRFAALTGNIRKRRGANVDIRMPRFRDTHTPAPSRPVGCAQPSTVEEANAMDEVYMDAMAFGMGCCCLQVTFQAQDVDESRHLYDQLAVLAPMMLALTASTPAARGTLLDTDSRWGIISQSVDDRTPTERRSAGTVRSARLPAANGTDGSHTASDGTPPKSAPPKVPSSSAVADGPSGPSGLYHDAMWQSGRGAQHKSRYDSISLYICNELAKNKNPQCSEQYNDVPAPMCEKSYARMVAAGIDPMLARHIAHLFSRDPLVIFRGRVQELSDADSTEHFENLQSTNWQTVRWKPPPASSTFLGGTADIGWRVEFRSMEISMTDFENAAFTVFIVLVSRIILYFNLNLYLPLSKVDENMRRAQTRDALHTQKMWFSQNLMPPCGCETPQKKMPHEKVATLFGAGEVAPSEVTVLEILTGKGTYRGLCPMIMAYLDVIGSDSVTLRTVTVYLDFIVARAAGQLVTPATWMRNYIRSHPDYKFDSVVSSRIATDLMMKCHRIGMGLDKPRELYGDFPIQTVSAKDAVTARLLSSLPLGRSTSHVERTMDRYSARSHLMAKKRALVNDLEQQRTQVRRTEESLRDIEQQLTGYDGPSL